LASISETFALTVNNTNDAPTLENAINDQSIDEDALYSFTFDLNTFNDVDATDSLSYTATQSDDSALPAWLAFDVNTRTFSGIPLNDDVGIYEIKVTATDLSMSSATDIFTLTVVNTNDAPTVANALSDQSTDEDAVYSFTFDLNTFNDVDAEDSLTYSATLDNDAQLPDWLIFNSASRNFSGTPLNDDVGIIQIKVTATDQSLASISDTFALIVNNTNDAPTLENAINDQSTNEDAVYSFTFDLNTFNDVDATDSLSYTATQSDNSALPAWLAFDINTRTFSGTPLNDDVGIYEIKVTATDISMTTATDVFTLTVVNTNDAPTVANALSDQNTDEDALYSFTFDLNTFDDVDAGDSLSYTATLDNDAQLPDWLIFNSASRNFSGTPLNDDVGTIQIKVTATDQSLASISDTFALTVNNTNDAPMLENAINDQSTDEDAVYSFTFDLNTFNDVDATDSLSYAATQSDDSALPAWLAFDINTRTFSGTPLNDDVGIYQIKVTATDISMTNATDVFTLTVINTNDAPTVANAMPDQNTDEDAVYSFTFDSNTFNDVDAEDSLTYSATLDDDSQLPGWLIFDDGTRTFTGTPLNDDVGTIQIKVTATDQSLASISNTFALTVNNTNDAPTLENAINDQSIDEDAVYSFTFDLNTFNDVDITDLLSYAATQSDDSALPAWLAFDINTRTFSGTPLNDDVGIYQIKVTATDISMTNATDVFYINSHQYQ
jgi:hypothetical protein